jgi:transcriptional regulator with XRE-family HTH domain
MGADDEQPTNLVGELIRQQRELAALPLRQLAALVGISNPYLSQIEHGLRAPSEHVLASIAATLRISPSALRRPAGQQAAAPQIPAAEDGSPAESVSLLSAIRADPALTAGQRRALAEIYAAMVDVTAARRACRARPGNPIQESAAPRD